MPEDIGQKLYELAEAEFRRRLEADPKLKYALSRVAGGTANQALVSLISKLLGERLSEVLRDVITNDVLPNGQMYYNVAQKILDPLLHENHDYVNEIAGRIQSTLDARSGIHIRPQTAPFPSERVKAVLNAAAGQKAERAAEIMARASDTITRSFADDYVKTNAQFRTEAGIQAYIVRTTDGDCCEWCSSLAGRYRYPEDIPDDIFRRHDNCGCVVTYECGGMRQDVHSKKILTPEEAAAREQAIPARVMLDKIEAEKRERSVSGKHPKSLDKSRKDDIIESSGKRTLPSDFPGLEDVDAEKKAALDKATEKIPEKVMSDLKGHVKKVTLVQGRGYSSYDSELKEIILDYERAEDSIVHELGHAYADMTDLYSDPEFIAVLTDGLELSDSSDVISIPHPYIEGEYVYLYNHPKFVNEYQGRVYFDANEVDAETIIRPEFLQEYISVGFETFYENPELLQRHDSLLYEYLEKTLK